MTAFVLSDETVRNSYGFHVLTEGIRLERFLSNPVMLNNHSNHTKDVLGSWADIRRQGTQLLASPDFDTEDADGKEVVRKVGRGKIKGASIGISFKKEDLQWDGDKLVLQECELMEASIVAVPSNAHAIALYAKSGELMTEQQVQQLCLSVKKNATPKKDIMNENVLKKLGLNASADNTAVLEAVTELTANLADLTEERDGLRKQLADLTKEENERLKLAFTAEKNAAVKDGRIDANATQAIDAVAETNLSQALALLQALPKREKVASTVQTADKNSYANLSWDELDRQGLLPKIKASDFSLYAEKYEAKFGVKPQNV
ncbi:MAG: HK97 family phage prohead protease [Capnocytophaga sp.]|nr:HK97 family phage prohead protease [Capnocytophaga sp.]